MCALEVPALTREDLDPVVIIGLLGGLILFLLCPVLAVYYLIKAIKTKGVFYVCTRCKSKLKADELIQNVGNDEQILLNRIRKRNTNSDELYHK